MDLAVARVTLARFIQGLPQANGIIAGITCLACMRFDILNALGAARWVALGASVGYFSGSHIDPIYNDARGREPRWRSMIGGCVVPEAARRVLRARQAESEDQA
jgi:membrane protein DedA with SNARE-associated domain